MRQNDPSRKPHWPEYACEFVGAALLCLVGLSAVTWNFAPGLPMERWVPSASARLLMTGLIFAGCGSLIAMSPIGKRSGAHLNPSVTVGFWILRKMHRLDALAYITAQFLGAAVGVAALSLVWKRNAAAVRFGMTTPGPGVAVHVAFLAELLITFAYLVVIFNFVSRTQWVKFTPLINWLLVSLLVWTEAPVSGASLNAARSFAPDLFTQSWQNQWIYLVAPTLGGALAALFFTHAQRAQHRVLTGKIYHSPDYGSLFKNVPHPALINAN